MGNRINKDILGEHIVLTNNMYPPQCLYFKNKDCLKSEDIQSIQTKLKELYDALKLDYDELYKFVIDNCSVEEVVVNEKGIVKFTLKD